MNRHLIRPRLAGVHVAQISRGGVCVFVRVIALVAALPLLAAQESSGPPDTLPAPASAALAASLTASATHVKQVWRDTPPVNADGTINGYVEIAKGDRRKWE